MWVAKNKTLRFFSFLIANLHLSVNQGTLGNLGLHWVLGMILEAVEVGKWVNWRARSSLEKMASSVTVEAQISE